MTITIFSEQPDSEESLNLIRQLDEDLRRRYPEMPAQMIHGLLPSDMVDPRFTFFIARSDGLAVGCGAIRNLEPGVAEVKRMFVLPAFRGRGVARRLLAALESRALELGHSTVRLETGKGQPEAICLYKSSGYREIAAFGEYAGNAFSVCFEKQLT